MQTRRLLILTTSFTLAVAAAGVGRGAASALGVRASRANVSAVSVRSVASSAPIVGMAETRSSQYGVNTFGYWLTDTQGSVFTFGRGNFFGARVSGSRSPVAGIVGNWWGTGYWLFTRDGHVAAHNSGYYGQPSDGHPGHPIVGMVEVTNPNGNSPGLCTPRCLSGGSDGYWLVDTTGRVYPYGNGARDYGSTANLRLAAPVVGIAAVAGANGFGGDNGYWIAAADGGVFTFGDAGFAGSLGGVHLAAPIVGIIATSSGHGYWLVGADGGVFAFGDAGFHGSLGATRVAAPIVGMARTDSNGGYWLVAANGSVYSFGDAPFFGSR